MTTEPRARARTKPVDQTAAEPAVQPVSPPESREVGGELGKVMAAVTKHHGPAVMRRATSLVTFKHIPTGIFTLDMGLLGGVPQGLVTMPYGWESSGKTTVAMRVVANAQRKYPDQSVVFIDAEGTFDPAWARRHEVDPEAMILVQPASGEQALDIADAVLRAQETSLVVIDSLPALMPTKELEKSMEDDTVAMQARLIGKFMRKVTQALLDERKRDHTPALMVINQFRSKIAMMGDTRSLPGGNATKFFVATRFEIKNREKMGRDALDIETVDYNEHSFVITKNKIGTGIRTGEFTMIRNPDHPLGMGFIDDAKTVVTYAKKFGVLSGGGSSWRMDGLDEKFGKLQEIADYFYSDLDYFEHTKRRLISMQRQHVGLAPDGWY
jgi:recombination protein RecA